MKLTTEVIKNISKIKKEDDWMLNFRLKCLEKFNSLGNPNFGPKLNIDYEALYTYINIYV